MNFTHFDVEHNFEITASSVVVVVVREGDFAL